MNVLDVIVLVIGIGFVSFVLIPMALMFWFQAARVGYLSGTEVFVKRLKKDANKWLLDELKNEKP